MDACQRWSVNGLCHRYFSCRDWWMLVKDGWWMVCVTVTLAAETDGCLSDKDGRWMVCVTVILAAQTDGCLSDKLVQSVQISDLTWNYWPCVHVYCFQNQAPSERYVHVCCFQNQAPSEACTCLLFSEPSPKWNMHMSVVFRPNPKENMHLLFLEPSPKGTTDHVHVCFQNRASSGTCTYLLFSDTLTMCSECCFQNHAPGKTFTYLSFSEASPR